jgi:hypothetical protein
LGSGFSTDLLIFIFFQICRFFRSGFYRSEKPPAWPGDFGVVFQRMRWVSNMLQVAAWSKAGGAVVVPGWAKSSRRFCYVLRFFSFYMLIWLLSENAGKDEEGIQFFLEENRGKQEA